MVDFHSLAISTLGDDLSSKPVDPPLFPEIVIETELVQPAYAASEMVGCFGSYRGIRRCIISQKGTGSRFGRDSQASTIASHF